MAPEIVDVLIVDDRPDGLLALEAVLNFPNIRLIKAASGQEALGALYGHEFAVILLDVQMPVMDGFETARLIRQYEGARETPIIFITAINKDSHHISRGYETGAIDYLFKPIDPDILKSKVRIFIELAQARRRLKQMNEELEARVQARTVELMGINRELEQFAYIASHDLQEPLRKIIIFSERLTEGFTDQLDATGQDYLERMRKAALRMQTVIQDLLVFSKISAKDVVFENVDLKEIIDEILSDLEIRVSETESRVDVRALPLISAHRSQIRHLFQNLILNSIKFAKKGTAPHIVIDSEIKDGFAHISVRDNGIGFDEKYADEIFKLFHRLHSKQEYEGSGIGLSICQKIAHMHGGKIAAYSKPMAGATFTVSLPLKPALVVRNPALLDSTPALKAATA